MPQEDNGARIRATALMGLICSGLMALLFLIWGGGLTNWRTILVSFVLAATLHLSIWFCSKKFRNLGAALLCVMAALTALTFVPYGFSILSIFAVYFLCLFVAEYRQKPLKIAASVFGFALLYALIILASAAATDSADPFIAEHMRQLSGHADMLFFAAMSTMFKNYGLISTGLHGMPWVHYHYLAYGLYGLIAKLLQIETLRVLRLCDAHCFQSTSRHVGRWCDRGGSYRDEI